MNLHLPDSMKPSQVLTRALLRTPPESPLDRRDPEAIAAAIELFWPIFEAWFNPVVEGLEHVEHGPALVVGSHNGGVMTPDMFALMFQGWRRFGTQLPAYGLAHDQVMRFPATGRLLGLLGAVPAGHGSARKLLDRGARLLVYPGGDVDAFRPFRERHVVKFAGRTGFVRLALRAQVPIVPVVSLGAHETFRVLTDGRELARALHLKALFRIEVLPIFLCLPWGVYVGPFEGHLPLPSNLRLRLLPPMRFDLPPSAAEDNELVRGLAEEVRAKMQAAVDEMAQVPGYGVRARLLEMWRHAK